MGWIEIAALVFGAVSLVHLIEKVRSLVEHNNKMLREILDKIEILESRTNRILIELDIVSRHQSK